MSAAPLAEAVLCVLAWLVIAAGSLVPGARAWFARHAAFPIGALVGLALALMLASGSVAGTARSQPWDVAPANPAGAVPPEYCPAGNGLIEAADALAVLRRGLGLITRFACNGVPIPAPGNVAQVDYPASNPNVLACGGTELVLQNGQHTEWVWNNTNTSRKGGAGGGGVSRLFGVPDYQANAGIKIPSVNDGSTGRVVPDVAGLAAAGDWNIFESDQGELIGGTSAVAPLWASLIALINEGRAQQGKAALGFVNDKLYALAAQGGLFNDVVNGNNSIAENYPGYEATAGFDACSGWGTPIGAKIVKALLAAD